jgi:HEAT repeat protein
MNQQRETTVGVFTTDAELIIRVWDGELSRLTGVAAEAACGRSLLELVPDLGPRGLLERFRRVLTAGVIEVLAPAFHHYLIPCPPRIPSPRFDRMQQRATLAPLREADVIVGVIVTIEDVTARLDHERDLAQQLASSDEETRLRAAESLAQEDGESPGQPLVTAIGDHSWRVRRVAVTGLARRAAPEAVAALLQMIREDPRHLSVLNSALQVLAMTEVDILSPLIEFLQDSDPDLRMQAALVLGEQGKQEGIPALLEALEDSDNNVRYHAIEALGKLRASVAAPALLRIAESRDFFLAFPAIDALRQIGDETVVPHLAPLLADEILCEPAAKALGELGDESVVESLVEVLNASRAPGTVIARSLATLHDRLASEGAYIADLTRHAINATGTQKLLEALRECRAEDLRPVALVLGWLEDPAVDQALARLLNDPAARGEAVEALVRHRQGVTNLVIEQLAAEDPETRKTAAVVLGRLGNAEATPALVQLLSEDDELKIVAAAALARIGDRRAFEPLLDMIGDAGPAVRVAVIAALNSLGVPEMPARLLPLLEDPDPLVRESAVKIAGYFSYPTCTGLLFERSQDEDERVRRAAVEVLPYVDDARVPEVVVTALQSDTPTVRRAAATALMHLESGAALPPLLAALEDKDAWVRYYAARALGSHRKPESLEALALAARSDAANHVRIAALEALGTIGGERAAEIIAPLLADEDPDLVRAAVSSHQAALRKGEAPALDSVS